MARSTARAIIVNAMAIEIIREGIKPKFVGICELCGTKFSADASDCYIEIEEVYPGMNRINATAKCPCCGADVKMYKCDKP